MGAGFKASQTMIKVQDKPKDKGKAMKEVKLSKDDAHYQKVYEEEDSYYSQDSLPPMVEHQPPHLNLDIISPPQEKQLVIAMPRKTTLAIMHERLGLLKE